MSTIVSSELKPDCSTPPAAHWPPEGAVLSHLLDQHPRRLTLDELAHEVGESFEAVTVMRAVENLTAARFLVRDGADVVPAPTVVDFDRTATEF